MLLKPTFAVAVVTAVTVTLGATSFAVGQTNGHAGHAGHGSHTAAPPAGGHAGHGAHPSRQAEVARVGATVMPFDLERTTHIFEPGSEGGVQRVVSKDRDPKQIELIREHLREEAAAFSKGDFGDPAKIHGDDMPGLAELRAGVGKVKVTYEDLPDGALLRYSTKEPKLVTALHKWFEAQVSDHGSHAVSH